MFSNWLLGCRRLLRVPWTTRRSNQSILKEINPEYSLEGLDAEAEAPILWRLVVKSCLIGKDPDAGKDWRQEQKGMTEDEMVEWYHWLDGHEFEQAPRVDDRQGSLACCSPWGCKELDMTEWLNWTDAAHKHIDPIPVWLEGWRYALLLTAYQRIRWMSTSWSCPL